MLRLYRKIYCIDTSTNQYTLINPTSISASCYVAGTGGTESSTSIETGISVTQEETGIYYADLTPTLYASDVTYDLVWYVQYTSESPEKKLTTRFRIKPYNIAGQLDYEVLSVYPIDIDVL
jgi:hypothetical protein